MVIEKLDLAKADKNYYTASKSAEVRDLDSYYYLTISGQSSPEDKLFLDAIGKLYSVAYAIKFLLKAEDLDFTVPKMEAFWFIEGGEENQHNFDKTPRDEWMWKIIIRMPDFVEESHFFRAVEGVKQKKGDSPDGVKYELINEGKCAQILHLGSYDDEAPTIQKLHDFIFSNGYKIADYHHEIYLSDPRRTAPEKLKTIIRYAIK